MATTAKQVIDSAVEVLHDDAGVRWPRADLLGYLNDGQREILLYRPDASTALVNHTLTAGFLQTLPAQAIRLMDVKCNVSGRSCKLAKRDSLDDQRPSWRTDPSSATVKAWTYDERDPKRFEVWPPATAFSALRLLISVPPADVLTEGASISLDDMYKGPLVSYIIHRAYLRDSEDAAMESLSQGMYSLMVQQLTGRTAAELSAKPEKAKTQRKDVSQ